MFPFTTLSSFFNILSLIGLCQVLLYSINYTLSNLEKVDDGDLTVTIQVIFTSILLINNKKQLSEMITDAVFLLLCLLVCKHLSFNCTAGLIATPDYSPLLFIILVTATAFCIEFCSGVFKNDLKIGCELSFNFIRIVSCQFSYYSLTLT